VRICRKINASGGSSFSFARHAASTVLDTSRIHMETCSFHTVSEVLQCFEFDPTQPERYAGWMYQKKKQGTRTPTTTTASHNHDHCCCVLPHGHLRVIYTHACFASWQSRFLVSQQNTTNIVSENPLRMLSTLEDLLGTHSLKRQAIAQVNNHSLPCVGARMFHCFRPYSTCVCVCVCALFN
jgi:hypothetical protein